MLVSYLGPAGTFTYEAARDFYENAELTPFHTAGAALDAVLSGGAGAAVLPVENSTEGIVNATADGLIFKGGLFIQKELRLPVRHHLLIRNGARPPFSKVLSHSQALSQCANNLISLYPNAEFVPVASTAEAARIVAESSESWCAVGTSLAAELYGLRLYMENIQDEKDNETRFVAVSKTDTSRLWDRSKTTIAFATKDRPGELYRILDIFSLWDVNMSLIVSRPMKGSKESRRGEYVFLVDLEIRENAKDVRDALTMVKRKSDFFKSLGCYANERSKR